MRAIQATGGAYILFLVVVDRGDLLALVWFVDLKITEPRWTVGFLTPSHRRGDLLANSTVLKLGTNI